MGIGDEAGLKAVEELEKVALPQIITELNSALGVFNLKVANVIDLGNKFQATLDRAVQVLERLEKKLGTDGITITL